MAQSLNRNISAQESSIYQDTSPNEEDNLESRFECPICIHWLNEPILTKCGHRFCKKCITSWLEKETACPIDKKPLVIDVDTFPDNFTRREIQQIKKACPNLYLGCNISVSPLEMDQHILECNFNASIKNNKSYHCTFNKFGCTYNTNIEPDFNAHINNNINEHLNLLVNFISNKNLENNLWEPPDKKSTHNYNNNLIKEMYERIVVLEQKNHEQALLIEKLNKTNENLLNSQITNGVLIWKIDNFNNKINAMLLNTDLKFYSNEVYTSIFGYKYCARINIFPKYKDYMSLHIHMMKSDNDYHLDWPFKGRIKISLIHPMHIEESKHDTIMSKPEILAFHRPTQHMNPKAYGFLEYASINDIISNGFVCNNTITIKIEVNLV